MARRGGIFISPKKKDSKSKGQDAGKGAHDEDREETSQEQIADGGSGAGQRRDQRGGGQQVEPVAQIADKARQPKIAVRAVLLKQFEVYGHAWS